MSCFAKISKIYLFFILLIRAKYQKLRPKKTKGKPWCHLAFHLFARIVLYALQSKGLQPQNLLRPAKPNLKFHSETQPMLQHSWHQQHLYSCRLDTYRKVFFCSYYHIDMLTCLSDLFVHKLGLTGGRLRLVEDCSGNPELGRARQEIQ